MQDPNRVEIERSPPGCSIIVGLVLLGWLGLPWLYTGLTKGDNVSLALGAVSTLIAVFVGLYRGGMDYDSARKKLIRWRRGLWPGQKEFDLDDCSVRVKTVNDSGIWHAVSIEKKDRPLSTKRSRGRDGFTEIREQARKWSELLQIPIYEMSSGRPVLRERDALTVPLIERLKRSGEPISAPPPNANIPISHEDGQMVFDLSKSRQKLFVSATALKITTNIFVTTVNSSVQVADIMELEIHHTSDQKRSALTLVTPEDVKSLAPLYEPADLEWLRNAILYSLLNLSSV